MEPIIRYISHLVERHAEDLGKIDYEILEKDVNYIINEIKSNLLDESKHLKNGCLAYGYDKNGNIFIVKVIRFVSVNKIEAEVVFSYKSKYDVGYISNSWNAINFKKL